MADFTEVKRALFSKGLRGYPSENFSLAGPIFRLFNFTSDENKKHLYEVLVQYLREKV